LAAVGLGRLTRNAVLAPVMGGLLTVLLAALGLDFLRHRHRAPLLAGAPSAAMLYFFVFVERVNVAVYVALSGVILARLLNGILSRRTVKGCRV